jgi:pyruvate dehydrogenase E2 component (dihydrolipoamide acetyltransferase)
VPAVDLIPKRDLSSFRKIALGTWHDAKDPSVYGALVVEVDAVLAYIEAFRAATGKRLTLTHLMAKALALVYAEIPDANAMIRWGGIWMRKDVAVFFQVAMEDPVTGEIDLSGVTIRRPDQKSTLDIVGEFEAAAGKVRAGKDEEKESTRQTFKRLPGWLVGWVLDLTSLLIYGLNLDLRWAGLPRDPFGSAMVTNIGTLGLEEAYVPLVPYSRVPLLIALGAVKRELVPDDAGNPRVAHTLRLCATFDHRILDGAHAAKMAKVIRRAFADPVTAFGPIPDRG